MVVRSLFAASIKHGRLGAHKARQKRGWCLARGAKCAPSTRQFLPDTGHIRPRKKMNAHHNALKRLD
jgi:hypothetical protein